MQKIIEKFKFSPQEIAQFKQHGVEAVVLFGSQALGLARENSDFDIGILLNKQGLKKRQNSSRGEVFNLLHDIFASHIKKLVDIDIVFLQTAPGELQAHAVKHAKLLYEQKPGTFANFTARIIEQYSDFEPLRKIFHQGILSRVP